MASDETVHLRRLLNDLQSLPKQSTDVPISQAGVPCGVVSVNVRRAFSCTSDGYVLISADYNQMEVLARLN